MAVAVKNAQLFQDLVKSLRKWLELNQDKKDANNIFNKGNTESKNLFKSFMQNEAFPAKTKIVIDGQEFTWSVAEEEIIDPRKWHAMWIKGEITEAQFFDAMSVGKKKAAISIGEDQVATISILRQGETADIRNTDKTAGAKKGIEVVLPEGIRPKGGGIRPRLPIPVQEPATRAPVKRNIIVRNLPNVRK